MNNEVNDMESCRKIDKLLRQAARLGMTHRPEMSQRLHQRIMERVDSHNNVSMKHKNDNHAKRAMRTFVWTSIGSAAAVVLVLFLLNPHNEPAGQQPNRASLSHSVTMTIPEVAEKNSQQLVTESQKKTSVAIVSPNRHKTKRYMPKVDIQTAETSEESTATENAVFPVMEGSDECLTANVDTRDISQRMEQFMNQNENNLQNGMDYENGH